MIDFLTCFRKAYFLMNSRDSEELYGAQQMYDFIRKQKDAKTYEDAINVISSSSIDEDIVYKWIKNRYLLHFPFEKEAFEHGYPQFKDEIRPPLQVKIFKHQNSTNL